MFSFPASEQMLRNLRAGRVTTCLSPGHDELTQLKAKQSKDFEHEKQEEGFLASLPPEKPILHTVS